MEELARLADQARRALEGEAWYGPAVLETLANVSSEAAAARPIAGVHSIWEIVLHLTATYRVVLDRVGHRPGNLTPEQDWPTVGSPDPERWRDATTPQRRGAARHSCVPRQSAGAGDCDRALERVRALRRRAPA